VRDRPGAGVAERFVVLTKPGNSGGGKAPLFDVGIIVAFVGGIVGFPH
jgi:hypothetical protein